MKLIKKLLVAVFAFVLLEICGNESRIFTFIFELLYHIYFQKSSALCKSSAYYGGENSKTCTSDRAVEL